MRYRKDNYPREATSPRGSMSPLTDPTHDERFRGADCFVHSHHYGYSTFPEKNIQERNTYKSHDTFSITVLLLEKHTARRTKRNINDQLTGRAPDLRSEAAPRWRNRSVRWLWKATSIAYQCHCYARGLDLPEERSFERMTSKSQDASCSCFRGSPMQEGRRDPSMTKLPKEHQIYLREPRHDVGISVI